MCTRARRVALVARDAADGEMTTLRPLWCEPLATASFGPDDGGPGVPAAAMRVRRLAAESAAAPMRRAAGWAAWPHDDAAARFGAQSRLLYSGGGELVCRALELRFDAAYETGASRAGRVGDEAEAPFFSRRYDDFVTVHQLCIVGAAADDT